MQLRRKIAIATSAVVLAVPALSSCGFDYATDRVYTPAAGTNNRDFTMKVLNAVVVAGQDDSGTFIAGIHNNTNVNNTTDTAPIELLTITSDGTTEVTAAEFEPISIEPRGFANLADDADIHLTGAFVAGDVIPLTLTFSNDEAIDLQVPVVRNCGDFEGYDTSGTATIQGGSETETETDEGHSDPYSCEVTEVEGGH